MTALAWIGVGFAAWVVLSVPAGLLAGRWLRQNGNKFAEPTLFIARPTTTGPDADQTSQRVGAS